MIDLLKPPSLFNFAYTIGETPEEVQKKLVGLARGTPQFSYRILFELVEYALVSRLPESQFEAAIFAKEKRPWVREILLEIIPHIYKHFSALEPQFTVNAPSDFYPISKGIVVPYKPAIRFGLAGRVITPNYIFWKKKRLNNLQLSLCGRLIRELMERDPDLEDSVIRFYTFAEDAPSGGRALNVFDDSSLASLSTSERNELLKIWLEGSAQAANELRKNPVKRRVNKKSGVDSLQHEMFKQPE